MPQKILTEILNRFFVTVEIYRRPGWKIFRNWVENFLKINKQGGTPIRDLRVQ